MDVIGGEKKGVPTIILHIFRVPPAKTLKTTALDQRLQEQAFFIIFLSFQVNATVGARTYLRSAFVIISYLTYLLNNTLKYKWNSPLLNVRYVINLILGREEVTLKR